MDDEPVEIEIAQDNPQPHVLRFNGRPVEEAEVHVQDGRGTRTYCYGLANQGVINPSFPGPYIIDIVAEEKEIIVSFTSQEDPSQTKSLSMPLSQWSSTFRTRDYLVGEYERLFKEWHENKVPKDDWEKANMARREHHNASASELMEDAKLSNIKMDHETARDLFAVVASLVRDKICTNELTYKGQPFELGGSCSHYAKLVTDTHKYNPGFSGPHRIDIAPTENHIRIQFRSPSANGQQAHLDLPIRLWKGIIQDRARMVADYDRIMIKGTASEITQIDEERKAHHDACARQFMHEAAAQGITMDHDAARDLFAVMASLTHDLVRPTDKGMGGPSAG